MKIAVPACAIAALLLVASPVWSHHSQVMYDETKMVTLKGTISKFRWINPHTFIHVDVTEKGLTKTWEVETNSAVSMAKLGWTRTQFKVGDTVSIKANPAKDGSTHAILREVTGPDGKTTTMPANGPERPRKAGQ